jgi:DNA-binding NarL/FixJ family response regulator
MFENHHSEDGNPYKVLVVDDHAGLLQTVRAQLRGCYEVVLADGGQRALSLIEEGNVPDIVLLDIDMPDMDGYETLEKLRDHPETEDIPVIFLTGLDGVKDQVRGLRSGVADYIIKPFEKDILLARLRLHIEAGMERRKMLNTVKSGLLVELDEEKFEQLTAALDDREKRVARLIALGKKNQDIASELTYSIGGVKKFITRICDKTGFSREELRNALVRKT